MNRKIYSFFLFCCGLAPFFQNSASLVLRRTKSFDDLAKKQSLVDLKTPKNNHSDIAYEVLLYETQDLSKQVEAMKTLKTAFEGKLNKKKKKYNATINEINEKLGKKEELIIKLNTELNAKKTDLRNLYSEKEDLRKKIEEKEEGLLAAEKKCDQLIQVHKTCHQEKAILQEKNNRKIEKIKKLKSEIEPMNIEKNNLESSIITLDKELKTTILHLEAEQYLNAELQKKIDEQNAQYVQLQQVNSDLMKTLTEKQIKKAEKHIVPESIVVTPEEDNEGQTHSIKNLLEKDIFSETNELKKEKILLENEIKKLNGQIQYTAITIAELNTQINQLVDECILRKKETEKTLEDKEVLCKQIESLTNEIQSLKNMIKQLKENRNNRDDDPEKNYNATINGLRDQLMDAKKQINVISELLNKKENEKESLRLEKKALEESSINALKTPSRETIRKVIIETPYFPMHAKLALGTLALFSIVMSYLALRFYKEKKDLHAKPETH